MVGAIPQEIAQLGVTSTTIRSYGRVREKVHTLCRADQTRMVDPRVSAGPVGTIQVELVNRECRFSMKFYLRRNESRKVWRAS